MRCSPAPAAALSRPCRDQRGVAQHRAWRGAARRRRYRRYSLLLQPPLVPQWRRRAGVPGEVGGFAGGYRAGGTVHRSHPLCCLPATPACLRRVRRMDEVCGQSRLFAAEGEEVRLPVAHMVCNQTPPVGGKPSLMTFRWGWGGDCGAPTPRWCCSSTGPPCPEPEQCARSPAPAVRWLTCPCCLPPSPPLLSPPSPLAPAWRREVETLFHEFGHAAQHMLTEQQEGLVAGIRGVEWDAVELPSQFMENW